MVNYNARGRSAQPVAEKAPPFNIEYEQHVLGCYLVAPKETIAAVNASAPALSPQHFYRDAHQAIARAIFACLQAGTTDALYSRVIERLQASSELGNAGGQSYLTELLNWSVTPDMRGSEEVGYYARQILEMAASRAAIEVATALVGGGYAGQVEAIGEAIERLQRMKAALEVKPTCQKLPLEAAQARLHQAMPDLVTLDELLSEEYAPSKVIVDGILYEGLTILAAKPKIGKSWLALGLLLAIASGGVALGKIPVERGDCLYLCLEDGKKRLQKRLKQLIGQMGKPDTAKRLTIRDQWKRIGQGGIEDMRLWLDAHPDARLIVIDTFKKIKPPSNSRNQLTDEDYRAIEPLHELALEYSVGILVIMHTRKGSAEDPLDEVSGSLGLNGAADNILVLRRERGKADAVLAGDGRDVRDLGEGKAMLFDQTTGVWTIAGDAEEYARSAQRTEVLRFLLQERRACSIQEVADGVKRTYEVTKNLLSKMARDAEIISLGNGLYTARKASNEENMQKSVTGVTPVTSVTGVTPVTKTPVTAASSVTAVTAVTDIRKDAPLTFPMQPMVPPAPVNQAVLPIVAPESEGTSALKRAPFVLTEEEMRPDLEEAAQPEPLSFTEEVKKRSNPQLPAVPEGALPFIQRWAQQRGYPALLTPYGRFKDQRGWQLDISLLSQAQQEALAAYLKTLS